MSDQQSERTEKRIIVFIDVGNVYQDLRRAFCVPPLRPTDGQFDPRKLAALLVTRGPEYEQWTLFETRTYLGKAAAARDPRTAAANDRQIAAWQAKGIVVRPRPLRYPADWPASPPQQKGVDVELAVDVVRLAIDEAYDVGIVLSTDTDLLPALEAVESLRTRSGPRVAVIGYAGVKKRLAFRDSRMRQPHCIVLIVQDYLQVMDPTIYVRRQ